MLPNVMNPSTFQKAYQLLNPQQKKAVDQIEGAVMVIAGPGTGKTQMLTLRIAKILMDTDTQPENILALTFTEAGVTAMRKRLVSIIGPTAYRVNIFTFHGLSNHCIQAYPDSFPHLINSTAITEIEQVEILETIFSENSFAKIKSFADPFVYLSAAKSAITDLKRENITPDRFEEILTEQARDLEQIDDLYNEKGRYKGQMKGKYKTLFKELEKNQELLQVYRQYQERLRNQSLYDFEDMLLELISQMESDDDFLIQLQEQYHYFLIDEHQDTNRAQNKIVELLASFHDNPNVFAVGDEKQAIYRFQGASLTNFLYLKQNYPEAEVISLSSNYRSSQVILDSAHSLIQNLPLPSLDLPLRDNLVAELKSSEARVEIIDTADHYGEYYLVANSIQQAISAGVAPSEIAILSRTNSDLHEMMRVLKQVGVPFVLKASQNILADLNLQKFITLLRVITNPGDNTQLFKTLIMDLADLHPLDIFRLQALGKENKTSYWQTLASADLTDPAWIEPDQLRSWYEKMVTWTKAANNQHPDETFTMLLKESGLLEQVLTDTKLVEALDRLVTLFHHLRAKQAQRPNFTLSDFVNFIDLIEKHNLKIGGSVSTGQTEAVQLMTAHGSKGLEFDRVYILNCFDQKWGKSYSGGARFKLPYDYMGTVVSADLVDDKDGDERRLFYVALTRARSHVTISYSNTKLDGRDQSPSRFISELDQDLITKPDASEFEADWAENRHQVLEPIKQDQLSPDEKRLGLVPVVQELLDAQGFSVSALNNYLRCPWKYFFRNLLRIPETKTQSLIFGSAIHESINTWIRQGRPDERKLLDFFSSYLDTVPLTEAEKTELKAKSKEVLPRYYQEKMTKWPDKLRTEQKILGVGLEPDIKLTGKLDLMIPISANEYRVVDFKTGKVKSRNEIEGKTQNSDGDIKRQLVFYQLLLDRFQGGKYKMKEGVIEFVEPNDSDKLKSEAFVISPEETKELEVVIQQCAGEIRNLEFWYQRCDDTSCEYCELREIMGR